MVDQLWSIPPMVAVPSALAGDVVTGTDEQLTWLYAHRCSGEVTALEHVAEDLVTAVVVAGDGVVARYVPCDVSGEDVPELGCVAALVEVVLGIVEPAEQGGGLSAVHEAPRAAASTRAARVRAAGGHELEVDRAADAAPQEAVGEGDDQSVQQRVLAA
jgi:hypothetical protein